MNREEYFYYNQKWQLLEIANADNVARHQFVWGTNYIDEAICMDVDTDTSGPGYGDCTDSGGSRHFFYCQDANWNVVALREGTSIVGIRGRHSFSGMWGISGMVRCGHMSKSAVG